MAYAYKRGAVWYVGYLDELGVQVRHSCKARSQGSAKSMAVELEVKAERVRLGIERAAPASHTWDQLCARYLEDVAPNHRNSDTTRSQMRVHVGPAFAGVSLVKITPADVDAWVTGLLKKKLANSTRELMRIRVQAVFTYAVRSLEWLHTNPATKSTPIAVPQRPPSFLTLEELQRVLAVPSFIVNEIAVAGMAGLRRGEVAGLMREDVSLATRTLFVRRSFEGATTKGGRERAIAIHDDLAPFLKDALECSKDPVFLFPSRTGGPRSRHWQATKEFRRVLEAAGITRTLSFKSLRATAGTHNYAATGDMYFVQHLLGHSDAKVTARFYAHALPEHRRAQANQVRYLSQNSLTYSAHAPQEAEREVASVGDVVIKSMALDGGVDE